MDCSEPFTLSIALMAMMPSAVYSPSPYSSNPQSWLSLKLRAREQAERKHCQRLLTVGFEAGGGALERLKGRVRLERLRQRLCTRIANLVVLEAANKSQTEVSAAADTCVSVMCGQEG